MSYYSDNNVKTKYIDPRVFVPGKRAVFDLDLTESGYLPNLKLAFLGLTSDTQTTYNRLLGPAAMIRSARLLDGKTVLSALNEAQFYKAFKNINRSNADAEARHSNVELTQNGMTIDGSANVVARVAMQGFADVNGIEAATNPTNLATIDLRDYFPILNALPVLPTALFKNLRIELEFNAASSNQVVNLVNTTLVQQRPLLIADCMINEDTLAKVMKMMPKEVVWHEVEHDQFVIPGAAAGASGNDGVRQRVNIKLNGYNNKIVDELLIAKEIGNALLETTGGTDVLANGKWSSQSSYSQQVQYRVNGRNILPREGIIGDNERMAFVVDTFGDCLGYPESNAYQGDTTNKTLMGINGSGQLDYMAIYLGKQINDLQINYSRVHLTQAAGKRATNELLIGHCYGSVRKQLMMVGNMQYIIDYQQN
tara:strand:- start:2795 stop:4066 length:1272 start_codon:yes stop_codon:yes gene_type:complete